MSTSGDVSLYSKRLFAVLKAIPGQQITAGKFNATAQVIIQVQ